MVKKYASSEKGLKRLKDKIDEYFKNLENEEIIWGTFELDTVTGREKIPSKAGLLDYLDIDYYDVSNWGKSQSLQEHYKAVQKGYIRIYKYCETMGLRDAKRGHNALNYLKMVSPHHREERKENTDNGVIDVPKVQVNLHLGENRVLD